MLAGKPNRYFGTYYRLLRSLGLGMFHPPEEDNLENYPTVMYSIRGIFSVILNVTYTLAEGLFALYVWIDGRESTLLYLSLILFGIHGMETIKIFMIIINNKKLQNIIRVLDIDCMRFARDKRSLDQSAKYARVFTLFFFITGETTIVLMGLYSVIVDMERHRKILASNTTEVTVRQTMYAVYVPWDTEEDLGYILANVFAFTGMVWVGSTLITCDTWIAAIITHIAGQFRAIQANFEQIGHNALALLETQLGPEGVKQFEKHTHISHNGKSHDKADFNEKKSRLLRFFSEDDYNAALRQCFDETVQYHQMIIGVTRQLQASFGIGFLCQILSSYYVIGLMLVQIALASDFHSMQFYNTVGFLISVLWQLFIQTYSANELTLQAEKVAMSAYSCMTHYSDYRQSRLLVVVIQRAQEPLHIRAGPFAPLSNELFLSTVKTAYQIFTLISTVTTNE